MAIMTRWRIPPENWWDSFVFVFLQKECRPLSISIDLFERLRRDTSFSCRRYGLHHLGGILRKD